MAARPYALLASGILGFAFAAVAVPSTASAMPLGHLADGAAFARPPAKQAIDATGVDFTAIVALSNCSGSLVRLTTSAPTDAALVLTNGHCLEGGFLEPGEAVVGRPSTRTFRLLSADASSTVATLTAAEVVYATMTSSDLTLYRLTSTYADIATQYGVQPLTISDHRAAAGTPIRVVSGYWKRIYSCALDGFVHELREANWTFLESLRYTQPGCEIIGGTSGSPVIDADTHEIIGVNNTVNEDGERCTLNNPCEVDDAGNVTFKQGSGYGQELYWIYGCLSPTNALDLTRPGCRLIAPAPAPAKPPVSRAD